MASNPERKVSRNEPAKISTGKKEFYHSPNPCLISGFGYIKYILNCSYQDVPFGRVFARILKMPVQNSNYYFFAHPNLATDLVRLLSYSEVKLICNHIAKLKRSFSRGYSP